MLATFGLDRLEASLTREPTPARAVQRPPQRPRQPRSAAAAAELLATGGPNDGLPTRLYGQQTINPEFRATRHPHRV